MSFGRQIIRLSVLFSLIVLLLWVFFAKESPSRTPKHEKAKGQKITLPELHLHHKTEHSDTDQTKEDTFVFEHVAATTPPIKHVIVTPEPVVEEKPEETAISEIAKVEERMRRTEAEAETRGDTGEVAEAAVEASESQTQTEGVSVVSDAPVNEVTKKLASAISLAFCILIEYISELELQTVVISTLAAESRHRVIVVIADHLNDSQVESFKSTITKDNVVPLHFPFKNSEMSLISAQLECLSHISTNAGYDYFISLAGDTAPILSLPVIEQELTANQPASYIKHFCNFPCTELNLNLRVPTGRTLTRCVNNRRNSGPCADPQVTTVAGFENGFRYLSFGSPYVILHHSFISAFLDDSKSHAEAWKAYFGSGGYAHPDESFWPTIKSHMQSLQSIDIADVYRDNLIFSVFPQNGCINSGNTRINTACVLHPTETAEAIHGVHRPDKIDKLRFLFARRFVTPPCYLPHLWAGCAERYRSDVSKDYLSGKLNKTNPRG